MQRLAWLGAAAQHASLVPALFVAPPAASLAASPLGCSSSALLPPPWLARMQVRLSGLPLLRLRADLSQGDPDPRFFQYIRGLMNVTAPTAGEQGRGQGRADLICFRVCCPPALLLRPAVPAPLPAAGPAGLAGKPGPPLFLSYPHFCDANPRLAAGVVGLQCRPKQHDLFLDVGG